MRFLSRSCVIGRAVDVFSTSSQIAVASTGPTQIGSTASPATSFRITMGAFVEGSTMRPRSFISMSIDFLFSPLDSDRFSYQTIGKRRRHPNRHVTSWRRKDWAGGGEIQRLVLGRTSDNLTAPRVMTLNRSFINIAYLPVKIDPLNFSLTIQQGLPPPGLLLFADRIRHVNRRSIRPRRILKRKNCIVLHFPEQIHRFNEVVRRLAGKTHNDVGGHADRPLGGAHPRNPLQI